MACQIAPFWWPCETFKVIQSLTATLCKCLFCTVKQQIQNSTDRKRRVVLLQQLSLKFI